MPRVQADNPQDSRSPDIPVEKLLVVVFLAVILWNLFAALYFMVSTPQADGRMVRALSWRIGLSIALLALLGAGHFMGWWQFHGLRP